MRNIFYALLLIMGLTACSESFLNNPPEDQIVVDNFFKTDDQLYSSGAALYGYPWFFVNEKFLLCMENYAGNAIGDYSDIRQFSNLNILEGNQFATEGWDGLYNVIGTANALLNNIETKVGPDVSESAIETVKGEAYFMRATAYFYLVRIWGAVPIIHSMSQYKPDMQIHRNKVADVYSFIIKNFEMAQSRLPEKPWTKDKGRVTSVACQAMLAEVYLTMKNYPKAKEMAENVLKSPDYGLLDNYSDVFHPRNNNSRESIFALQWVGIADWGFKNTNQAYLAAAAKITGAGDGWGTFVPSIDLQKAFEPGDLRKHATVMMPGDFYPELVTEENGFTVPPTGLTTALAGFRKYVVGSVKEWPAVGFMQTDQNTYIMRYADVLLIHAEAILAAGASTSDANALKSFNTVRKRAGLVAKTSITFDDIIKERRVELAVEAKYWFDLARMDRTKAKSIIAAQERGEYIDRDITKLNSKKLTADDSDFLFPIPGSEKDFNPLLKEEPVDFDFSTL